MNTRKTIIALATILTVGASSLAATPAAADDYDRPKTNTTRFEIPIGATPLAFFAEDVDGKPIRDAKVRTEIAGGKNYIVIETAGVQALSCSGWNSPSPTYSWSNHTMHYGMFAQCNEPVELRARGSLWSGPYPESTNTLQASLPGGGDWRYGVTYGVRRPREQLRRLGRLRLVGTHDVLRSAAALGLDAVRSLSSQVT